MKKITWILVLVLATLTFMSMGINSCCCDEQTPMPLPPPGPPPAPTPSPPPPPTFTDRITDGETRINDGAQEFACDVNTASWSSAVAGTGISPGTWLMNASSDVADVTFGTTESDVAYATMYTGALLQTRRPDNDTLFDQICGNVYVNKKPQYKGSFNIRKFGKLETIGTAFRISVETNEAKIAVWEGSAVFIPLEPLPKIDIPTDFQLIMKSRGVEPRIDPYEFTPEEKRTFEKLTGIVRAYLPVNYAWRFLTISPPFNDIRVKAAVCLALDEEALGSMFLPDKLVNFYPEEEFADKPWNIDLARQLLAEAGYPEGFEMLIAAAPADDENVINIVKVMSAQLWDAGIVTDVVFYDDIDFLNKIEFPKEQLVVLPVK